MSVAPPPALSVIITTHNRPRLLKRALEALRPIYDRREFEIIVVDDLGMPATLAVVAEQLAGNVSYFLRRDGPSVARSRNHGVKLARGRWITFCDDDDSLNSNWLDWVVRTGDQTPDRTLLGHFQHVLESREHARETEIKRATIKITAENVAGLDITNQFPVGSFVVPAQYARNLPFDCSLQSHEDWEYLLRLKSICGFAIAPIISCHIYDTVERENQRSGIQKNNFLQDYKQIYRNFASSPEVEQSRLKFLQLLEKTVDK